jgi:hypothetical protein
MGSGSIDVPGLHRPPLRLSLRDKGGHAAAATPLEEFFVGPQECTLKEHAGKKVSAEKSFRHKEDD